MDLVSLAIQLISGAAGGNIAGALLKKSSLGFLGNTIAGLVGGGLGGQILQSVLGIAPAAAGALDAGSIIAQVAGSGAGGGVLMVIIGLLRKAFAK